ncbi:MAG: ATP-dependent DNA helicase RecG [Clostridia bacterium]|nr:ATP-dependent DNA helicase RecG [Clostridia bacterium]
MQALSFDTEIDALSGIGETRKKQFNKLGIYTLFDLCYCFPRAYENRGDIKELAYAVPDVSSSFVLTVASEVSSVNIKRGLNISKFRAFDNSGSCEVVFFNSPFVKDVFHTGQEFRFYGKPSFSKRKLTLTNPKYEPIIDGVPLPDLVPIYSKTDGLSSKIIDKYVRLATEALVSRISDPIPDDILLENNLAGLSYVLYNAHFPSDEDALKRALSRLAFDEMLYFALGIGLQAHRQKGTVGVRFNKISFDEIISRLPFELTRSQKDAMNDIYKDTVLDREDGTHPPMARIIVGDVGCGKTVCATLSLYLSAKSGYQSAFMAPTEILARQHYEEISALFSEVEISVALLLGSTTKKEKQRIYDGVRSGEIDVVIGTHALLSDKLDFYSLGLIITDEQHRFGVNQRGALKDKVSSAHLLVMSATPIPRTLALTMYGDLDISRITEMPKGRQRVDTFVVTEDYRQRLNSFIESQVKIGGQCYIVCPAIESEDNEDEGSLLYASIDRLESRSALDLKNVIDYTAEIKKALPSLTVEYLHGRMKPKEKDEIMSRFASGETSVLVSTTVIEVGINVPNATLMVIENAERFGLSALHQLRGRVGRGSKKSYCVLVSDSKAENSVKRLEVMKTTYDGYEIAEKDLMQRGPGDFFSRNRDDNIRQSGGLEFKFASMCNDSSILNLAFSIAKSILSSDPTLDSEKHAGLKSEVQKRIYAEDSTIS